MTEGPRNEMKEAFIKLLSTNPFYQNDTQLCIKTSSSIEISCYNETIHISKTNGIHRNWSDPTFINIYGTRCGSIFSLLDPESISCKAYGDTAMLKLINGEIKANQIGHMAVVDICPQSRDKESAEIAIRSEQKVLKKVSDLFKCPHCFARRCEYQQVQIRSLDEAPDYFCLCLDCNKQFKGH